MLQCELVDRCRRTLDRAVRNVMQFAAWDLQQALRPATLLLIGISGFLIYTNWRLTLSVLTPIPVVLIISAICWKPISQKYFRVIPHHGNRCA